MNAAPYLERLARRILCLIGVARVPVSDDGGSVQTVQAVIDDAEVIDSVPRMQEFGFSSRLPAGSDIVLVFLNGDRSKAIAVASNHQASRQKGLAPGESKVFSEDGKFIHFTAGGGIVIEAKGQDVVVNNAKDVTVNCSGVMKVVAPGGIRFETPTFDVTGEVKDRADSDGTTMETIRQTYDAHVHSGVVAGGATTDVPTTQI